MDDRTRKKRRHAVRVAADTTAGGIGLVLRTGLKAILTVLLIVICTGLLFACVFAAYVKTSLSTDLDVTLEDFELSLSSTIYYTDANGQYQEMAVLQSSQERFWVDMENMPGYSYDESNDTGSMGYLAEATIAIEDKRFFEHKGVDWYRTAGAFVNMFLSMQNDFGGSSVTQQLLKNITEYDDVTVQRKLLEIFRALELEKTYKKSEIMGWYLNVVYFGSGANGVGAAARAYFDKEVWDLTLAECASIIGITNNPSIYSPYVSEAKNKERQELILKEMYDQGYISQAEYTSAKNEKLIFKYGEGEEAEMEIYSYYEEVVIQDAFDAIQEKTGLNDNAVRQKLYNGGLSIYACVDPEIQRIVDNYYQDPANLPQSWANATGQQLQSAIVILDPYTGDIVALCGGVGEKTINFGFNRATIAQRPPGSSIKPIAVYGPAMELGLITQNTTVNDAPNIVLSGNPNWYPKNSGGGNSGVVTIRTALQRSLNTVSAQILDKLSPKESRRFLETRLGVTSLIDEDEAYAPLSLGQLTNGITVREMAQAYGAFANDGIYLGSRTFTHINDSEGNLYLDNTPEGSVAFSPNTARNMTDMMYNAVNAGTGTAAALWSMPVAGKTGTTTKDMDRYFVGYTPYYVAAVWTGYDTPAYMAFSANPACLIFKSIMGTIHADLPYKSFSTDFTIGSPTNIFGDMTETTETPSPEPTESPSPSPEETVSPSPGTSPTTNPPVTSSTPTAPVSPSAPVEPTPTITDTPAEPTPPPATVAPEIPVEPVTE